MAFDACLRHGSVTRAAEELSLAQPTVSCMLRKLAETFGTPILVLRRGRMEATAAGREIAVLCEDLFSAFERFESRRGTEPAEAPALAATLARVSLTNAGYRVTLDVPAPAEALSSALLPLAPALDDDAARPQDADPGRGASRHGRLRGNGAKKRVEGRHRNRG
jgi:hypothetical protein